MATDYPLKAILFTKTAGYRHDSIPALISAAQSLFSKSSSTTSSTSSSTSAPFHPSALITTESSSTLLTHLRTTQILILGDNTGDFLPTTEEKTAVQEFIARGGNILGIHSCTAGETEWAVYGDVLGGVFDGHPKPQWGVVSMKVDEEEHFITKNLPAPPLPPGLLAPIKAEAPKNACPEHLETMTNGQTTFPWFDEWYNWKPNRTTPMPGRRDLITVNETTYEGGTSGEYHPIAWAHEYGEKGSRVFYTSLGHFDEAFADPWFMAILERGLYWVARREDQLPTDNKG